MVVLRARELGAGPELAALVVALVGIGQLMSSLPAGMVIARVGERRMMIACGVIDTGAMLLAWQAESVSVLAVAVMLSGATWTGFLLSRQGFIIDAVPISHRARGMSMLGASSRVGVFVGPLIGAGLIAWQGLSSVFAFAAVMAACSAVLARVVPDLGQVSRLQQAEAGHLGVWEVLRAHSHTLLTLGVAIMVIQASRAVRVTLLPLWADHIGVSASHTSLIFALAALVDIVFFVPGGWLMDHRGRSVVAVPVVLAVALASLLLPLTDSAVGLVACAVLIAAGNGLGSGIAMTIGADTAPRSGRSQYFGGWRLCGDIGGTVGPFAVSGLVAIAPLATACLALGGIGLVGTAWVGYWTRRLDAQRSRAGETAHTR